MLTVYFVIKDFLQNCELVFWIKNVVKKVKCYKSVLNLGVIDALWCVIGLLGQIIGGLLRVIIGVMPVIVTLKGIIGVIKCVMGIL